MAKKGYSTKGLFGTVNHYDNKGKKIGESRPGIFGGMNHYDANGHKTGESRPGIFGGPIIMIIMDTKLDIARKEFCVKKIIMMKEGENKDIVIEVS